MESCEPPGRVQIDKPPMVHWRRIENCNILSVFKASQWNFWTAATIHHNLQRTQIFLPYIHTLIFNLGNQITCTQNR